MTSGRVALLAGVLALALAAEAAAQMPMTGNLPTFDNAPPAPPPGAAPPGAPMGMPRAAPGGMPGGPQAGFPGPQAAPQEPPCFKDFMPLRQEAERRAGLIKSASDRKAPRPEVCQLFKNFASAEAKVVSFVSAKQSQCGIPQDVVGTMKSNHDKTLKIRDQVCGGGPMGAGGPAPPPPAPRLSDELGIGRIPGPNTTSTGRGTFDTLTGNPLSR
jgi:hypothetical protein